MTATASGSLAQPIVASVNLSIGLAKSYLDGVEPAKFARKPDGINTNHPAFIYGHLALYPDMILEALGSGAAGPKDEAWSALFGGDAVCRDDPDGSIYPPMAEITDRFFERYNAAKDALAKTDDAVLAADLPDGAPFKEFVQTNAGIANFVLVAHTMMHLGQVSAWRRCMGLGPAKLI